MAHLFVPVAGAHTFHASLAQVEYDAGEKRVEVAIRLFTDDLESALGRRAGRRVRLDLTPSADAMALAYLRETFELKAADGRKAVLRWVGWETAVDVTWVYVEADLAGGLAGARLTDRILFELFDDQVNAVNVVQGREKTSLAFQPGDGEKVVAFPQSAVRSPQSVKSSEIQKAGEVQTSKAGDTLAGA